MFRSLHFPSMGHMLELRQLQLLSLVGYNHNKAQINESDPVQVEEKLRESYRKLNTGQLLGENCNCPERDLNPRPPDH